MASKHKLTVRGNPWPPTASERREMEHEDFLDAKARILELGVAGYLREHLGRGQGVKACRDVLEEAETLRAQAARRFRRPDLIPKRK